MQYIYIYSIVQKIRNFHISILFIFSRFLRWAMQIMLIAYIKEDVIKIFHALLLTSYEL